MVWTLGSWMVEGSSEGRTKEGEWEEMWLWWDRVGRDESWWLCKRNSRLRGLKSVQV